MGDRGRRRVDGSVDEAVIKWESRVIPTRGAASTAVHTADDGHTIQADYIPATPDVPAQLLVTCEPLTFDDGSPPAERWPTFDELVTAADELAPGGVLQITFFGNPEGVERVPVPPGTPRVIQSAHVGAIQGGRRIEVVPA